MRGQQHRPRQALQEIHGRRALSSAEEISAKSRWTEYVAWSACRHRRHFFEMASYGNDNDVDPKLPTWSGEGGALAKEKYLQEVFAYFLGSKDEDKGRVAVRLWNNLRGEIKQLLQDTDLTKLVSDPADAQTPFKFYCDLIEKAYPESKLRGLPRVYKGFFRDVKFSGNTELFFSEMHKAKLRLEKADGDTKISDGVLGVFVP